MNWFEEDGGGGGSCVNGFRQKCRRGSAGSDNDEVGYGDGSCIRITSEEFPDLALCFNSFQHCQKLCLQSSFGQANSTADISKVFTFF
jgi:hypothetical protein